MKKFLLIVEPLRLRAVQRWLDSQGVLLVCSREFVAPKTLARAGRPAAGASVVREPRALDVLRTLHRPALYRGRAMSHEKLLARYPAIAQVSPGDLLIAPHLPTRGAVSIHRVGPAGVVAGSSATSALPLGIAVSDSWLLADPLVPDAEQRMALVQGLPMPTGPVTPLRRLSDGWESLLASLDA